MSMSPFNITSVKAQIWPWISHYRQPFSVGEGVPSPVPEFRGQRLQKEGEKDQISTVKCCHARSVGKKKSLQNHTATQSASAVTRHFSDRTWQIYWPDFFAQKHSSCRCLYLLRSIKSFTSSVFTRTHEHMTYSKQTSHRGRAIRKSVTQFDFRQNSRSLRPLFCFVIVADRDVKMSLPHYLTLTYLLILTVFHRFHPPHKLLITLCLPCTSRCLPLTNLLRWTQFSALYLLHYARACRLH